eukprot:TRINITY_DN1957_c2_g4_i1.p1 TRINITY_DN1957_c2_g4~~TRINITY_DN1957_c2_g4_i1.p1  ORF type:complete len:193 (+),score=31.19 TRINITY_DN1957_c2_g4_i1:28-579(+)
MHIPNRKTWSEVQNSLSYHETLPIIAEIVSGIAQSGSHRGVHGGVCHHPVGHVFECPPSGPGVSLQDYLIRLCKYGMCSSNTFVTMVVLIDRIATKAHLPITERNIHKLLLATFLISVKLTEDQCYSNAYYAGVGGMSTSALNSLEKCALQLLNWDLFIAESEYNNYLQNFEAFRAQNYPRGV